MPSHIGQFEEPTIEAKRGQGLTLLISDEFFVDNTFQERIASQLRSDGHIVEIAMPARRSNGFFRLFSPRTTNQWLSKQLKIDLASAQRIISALPIDVHPKLDWNAGTSRTFLGVAVALHTKPDVLIYSSIGMDPRGVIALHDFITSIRQDFFAVYINTGCDKTGQDTDYMSLPYSQQQWLKQNA